MKMDAIGTRILITLACGVTTGSLGVVLFATAHAALISPIWSSLFGGLPIGVAVATAGAWAFAERFGRAGGRWRPSQGAWFGALLWVGLLPMTLVAAVVRGLGLHDPDSTLEVVVAILMAAAGGVGAGYVVSRRRRGAMAMGVAVVSLVLAMGGPIALFTSDRAMGLFLAFAGLLPACGSMLAWTMTRFSRFAQRRNDAKTATASRLDPRRT